MTDEAGRAATADSTQMRPIEMVIDEGRTSITGWAAFGRGGTEADDGGIRLALRLAGAEIGRVPRALPRPDVDAHVGYGGSLKGFAVGGAGAAAFARFAGMPAPVLHADAENGTAIQLALPSAPWEGVAWSGMALADGFGGQVLVDLWFAGRHDLCLRFDLAVAAGGARKLDAYQATAMGELVRIAEGLAIEGGVAVATLRLASTLLPVLLVLLDGDDAILFTDFVAFPSLVRGGPHEVERRILGGSGEAIADHREIAGELVEIVVERRHGAAGGIGRILLDPRYCTGTEWIFDRELVEWLMLFLGISIELLPVEDEGQAEVVEALSRAIAALAGPARAGATLMLPENGLPTLTGLLLGGGDPGPDGRVCPFAVASWNQDGAAWSVSMPATSAWLDDLQPRGGTRLYPLLRAADRGEPETPLSASPRWPMAILFLSKATQIGATSPLQRSEDFPGRLIDATADDAEPITVIVTIDPDVPPSCALVEALARQTIAGTLSLIVCVSERLAGRLASWHEALSLLFPGRHSLIVQPHSLTRAQRIDAVLPHCAAPTVLLIDGDVVPIDSRTVETLAALVADQRVGSAGGLLVRAKGNGARHESGGYFLSGASLTAMPSLTFDTIDAGGMFPMSTYPVAANALAMLMIRTERLRELGGVGRGSANPAAEDVTFGLRLLDAGYFNLCTSAVAAVTLGAAPRRTGLSPAMPFQTAAATFDRLVSQTLVMQRIR